MQVRRKRGTSSVVPTHDSCLSVTIISMTMCLVVCIILSYHSYFQLDIDQLSTSRLFITNKIDSFKSEVGSLISEIEHNKGFNDVESPEINVSIHHELQCPHSELFHFWKETTISDFTHKSPFANYGPANKYVTFEPDVGGWNNIRMQMELVLVFAAATGRTLVLPPDQPMYLLNAGKGHQKAHNFADFFPFELIKQRVPVMAMEEFLAKEAVTGGLHYSNGQVAYPPENKTEFVATDRTERLTMWAYLRNVSACPAWKNMYDFLVIPEGPGINASSRAMEQPLRNRQKVFSAGRKPYYYDDFWQNQKVIHFISKPELGYRLLEHFYVFLHFHDVEVDKVYKRFVRDYVHYIDVIFCKASLIVNKLLVEGKGRFSTFHIRRGEFQYKEVKIPAEKILENVGQFIPAGELIYVATDEKNKSFFDAFRSRWPTVRFLDDYVELAGLQHINPNYLGMIDQVVCAKGTIFVGTWFSTFSGYITRLRGYLGYNDDSVYYGDKKHRDRFHVTELPMFPFYMREWNISWVDID